MKLRWTRIVPVAAVVVGIAAAGGIAAMHPAAPRPAPAVARQVAISRAVLACPPGANGGQNRVAVFSASAQASDQGQAAQQTAAQTAQTAAQTAQTAQKAQKAVPTGAELTPLAQAAGEQAAARQERAPATVTTPGELALLPVPATSTVTRQQAWSVTAQGAMAPALEAEVADSRGLTVTTCAEPTSDAWFVGPGQQNGASQLELYLMNVDNLPATVNLSVVTDAGSVQSSALSGITVPAHQLVTEALPSVTNGASAVAIEVRSSAGRVAAAVSESGRTGGATWLPEATGPVTRQVIPGVPPSSHNAGLLLVVPGAANARVTVAALTPQGQYQPFGSQQIDLPGGSASYVQLSALAGPAAGLTLTSNVPVTAEVDVPGGSGIGTFTPAAAPVTENAVIAGSTTASGLSATLAVTAPGASARVRITLVASGKSRTDLVTVPAGRTASVPVSSPGRKGTPFSVVVTPLPGSGPVYAARVETQGNTVVSIVPASSALSSITLPPVRDSYEAIAP